MAEREATPMDQAVFDATLQAELAKGTDRRVADGRAKSAAVRAYHRLLVWDLTKRPWLTRTAERVLDPLFGKSLVVYADKPLASAEAASAAA